MSGSWLVAFVVVSALVLCEAFVLFGLARQIGLLHVRLALVEAKPVDVGLPLGASAPSFIVRGLDGTAIDLGNIREESVLVMFVSANCAGCHDAIEPVKALQRALRGSLQVLLVSRGTAQENRNAFLIRHGLQATDVLFGLQQSDEIARLYQVDGTPFVFLLDAARRVRAKGVAGVRLWRRLVGRLSSFCSDQ